MCGSWYQVFAELTVKVQRSAPFLPCPDPVAHWEQRKGTVRLPSSLVFGLVTWLRSLLS